MKSAIVVGAGLAGLSAALELSRRGIEVTVFESADRAGGRARELRSADGAYRFDMGPTIITMPDVLRSALGEPAYSSLHLERLDPGYSVFWPDDRFDMRSDIAEWLAEVARLGCKSNAGALKYIADVHEQYVESRAKILDVDHNIGSAVSLLLRPGRLRPWVFGNLRRFAEHHFNARRVVEAMTFQTLYLGLSPARAQAIYALLGVQEIVGGVWFARGGTSAIVDAFVSECRRNGVVFRFGLPVRLVPVGRKRASGVIAGGALHEADSIVIAADREPALRNLLVDSMRREVRYGHSAVVYYLGIRGSVDIPHHAVFLPDDPWNAYDALDDGRLPDEALFYACNPARSVGSGDRSSLVLLAPVPNRAALRTIDYEALLQRLLLRLRTHNVDVAHRIDFRAVRGPEHFESELGLQYGAAFGPAHDLAQMGPLRPSIRYRGARNVAFAGSGTHPGSGVPMVITSGRLAAKHLLEGVR